MRFNGNYRLHAPLLALLLTASLSCGCRQRVEPADMVLLNGRIVTVDETRPVVQALAVRGDTVAAVGPDVEIRPFIGRQTMVLDLGGKFAMPGFIDGHAHLLELGHAKMRLDLTKAGNWGDIASMVHRAVQSANPDDWILGWGWHQEKWNETPSPAVGGYPTHHQLSEISPHNPVLLTHASGHAMFANARAMELAEIDGETPDPIGGVIVRDPAGNPIGVFLDSAQDLVWKALAKAHAGRTAEQVEMEERKAVDLAVQDCLSKGVTSFQDASSSFSQIDLFRKLAEENKLGIRLWVMIHEDNQKLARDLSRYKIINLGDKRLTVRAVKRFMDGALGSHTAWLLQPYSDVPSDRGLNVEPTEEISETAGLALENGFQLCVHAIGDRANRETLNIYESVFRGIQDPKALRWRIEHAQHLDDTEIPRFAHLGVIASMQAIHCTSDGPWAVKRLGAERARNGAYVWRKLISTGALVTNGTDAPVEDIDPIANFHAAVTRRLPDGSFFYPEQRMSREEALRACTINNAYAAFEEDIKGSLTPGKLADVTVLSKDILSVPEEEIISAEVLCTIVGGRIVYRR